MADTAYTPLALWLALGIGAALGAGAMHYSMRPRPRLASRKEAGYYVLLYDLPKGTSGRKISEARGPFLYKSDADRDAKYQRDEHAWYTSVIYSQTRPVRTHEQVSTRRTFTKSIR